MRIKNVLRLSLAATLGLAFPLAHGADLWTVYELAAKRDPQLGQARAQIAVSQENLPLARAALLPKVDAAAGINRHRLTLSGFGPGTTTHFTGNNYSITLSQPVFNGQSWVALRAARADIRGAQANLLAAQQNLILRVTQAYFALLNAQEQERIAQSEKNRLEALLRQAQAFLKAGTGEIISVREAEARVSGAEAALIQAQNNRRIAEQQLYRLTQQPITSVASLAQFEPMGPQPATVGPWIASAEANQPLLTAAREQLNIATEQVEIARRERWPVVTLDGGYVHNKGGFTGTIKTDDWFAGLNLTMPLYDAGEISARTRQARARAQQSSYQLEDLRDEIRLNTETAFLRLQDSMATLKALQEQVRSAQVSLEATRKGREIGTRTNVDVLNAVQALASAERNLNDARYNHVLARVQLKQAAGVLTEDDVRALNAMLAEQQPSS
ncbi:TolC family outer membrane protein [Thermithiobacillus tepidarius DSM 3134]|uniref:TolC family outer membrane protein n=1 Tax=Thermithiobacillus tepidarius TaxID=929 RepID=UPI0004135D0E|nr:TolC family outer membrane protein [Thermithiobacillus tepidarius]